MIELRTLGPVDLRRSTGVELRAVLQQPKRLGLLAYLAIARPGKLVRRDSLIALFWPDLDQEHARAALRRALYFLRQACGDEVIIGRGDEEVGLAEGALWCDAVAFDQAVARDDPAQAMELYQGDLLEGFYVAGAPEVEAWLDRERAARREAAGRAAWNQAWAGFPDLPLAQRWARRALDLAPYDEKAIRAYLEQLDHDGDRTAALRLYDEFARRLQADLAVEPAEETRRLVQRLRAAAAAHRVSPEQEPAAATTGRDALVVVCPFAVHGDPAFSYLGDGLVSLVSTKLDGTGQLRTADPRTVLRLAEGQTGGSDLETGRRLTRLLGASFFILGAVVESGGRLEAGLGLYHADGRLRTRVEGRAGDEAGLFELVDDLVRRLVAEWSDSAAERLSRLAALTTSSLAALKAYLTGEHEFRLGRHLQALDAFRRATTEDRSFALAYYRLASSLAASALMGPARVASAEAYRHRERLSDHDRLLLEAQHAWLRGASAEAERRCAALTVDYPEHLEPWFLLGDVLFHSNPYRGRSVLEAKEPFERTLTIDPEHLSALTQLARIASLEGRLDELTTLLDRALALSPRGDQAMGLRALRAFALGRTEDQRDLIAELQRATGLTIARAFSDVALYTRDWESAERLGKGLLPAARSQEFQALGHIMLAHLALARGRVGEAFDLLRLAARHEPAWSLEVKGLFAALPFLRLPDADREAVERELREWDPGTAGPSVAVPLVFHNGLHPHFRGFLLGLLAARRRDPQAVVLEMEALTELPVPQSAEVLAEHLARTLEAEAFRLQGRPGDALAALERLKTDVWFQLAVGSPFYADTYQRFLRAELLVEAGRTEEALGWWESIAQRSPYELVFLAAAERRQAEVLSQRGRVEQAHRHEAQAKALWTGTE